MSQNNSVEQPEIRLEKAEDYRDSYANSVQVRMSVWDFHLVFGTIHASTVPSTISRILDLFPREMHAPLRQNMAFNLKAVVAQKLLPTTKEYTEKTGSNRVPTNEIMRSNPIIRKLILNEEDNKLGSAINMGKEEGMQDFTESLRQLVVDEKIERAVAFEYAPSVEILKMALKGINLAQPGIL